MNIIIKRIVGFAIDLMVVGLLGVIIGFVLVDTGIIDSNLAAIILLLIFLLRDLYNKSGSLGKKVIGIKIIEIGEYYILRKVLRNFTSIIWPIEGIILIFIKKRLGDILAGTSVVHA